MPSTVRDPKWEEYLAHLPQSRRRRARRSLLSNLSRAVGLPPPLFWVTGRLILARALLNFIVVTFWLLVAFRGILFSLAPAHPMQSFLLFTGSLTFLVTCYQLIQARYRLRRDFGVTCWRKFHPGTHRIRHRDPTSILTLRIRKTRKWLLLAGALILVFSGIHFQQQVTHFREVTALCQTHPSESVCYEAAFLADQRQDFLLANRSLERLCDQGNAGGCADLANLHLDQEDAPRARAPAEKSCDLGDPSGCYQLAGALCLLQETKQAETALKKASSLGHFKTERTRRLASFDPALHCLQNKDVLRAALQGTGH